MKAETVFRPLQTFERTVGDLYSLWAKVFQGDHAAGFLFAKLASDERGHANLVDYQRRMVQKDQSLAGDVDLSPLEIQQGLARVQELLAKAPPSLSDAVRLAYELEISSAEGHTRNAIRQAHPDLRRLLECLAGEEGSHRGRLESFAQARGIPLPVPEATGPPMERSLQPSPSPAPPPISWSLL